MPALELHHAWEGSRRKAKVRTGTWENRLPGIAGGPGETWPMVLDMILLAPKGASHGTQSPTGARAPALSRPDADGAPVKTGEE